MASDPFDDLLDLEDNFYREGYDAGLNDGQYAGRVEGKVFGIEKGYEKALELGKLRGRAMVWQARAYSDHRDGSSQPHNNSSMTTECAIAIAARCSQLPKNARLGKHVEALFSITDDTNVHIDNSDEAVADFEERLARAQAKAKVIAAIANEPLKVDIVADAATGIEESRGLNARH